MNFVPFGITGGPGACRAGIWKYTDQRGGSPARAVVIRLEGDVAKLIERREKAGRDQTEKGTINRLLVGEENEGKSGWTHLSQHKLGII